MRSQPLRSRRNRTRPDPTDCCLAGKLREIKVRRGQGRDAACIGRREGRVLDEHQKELLQESLPLVRACLLPASTQFYDNLFVLAPHMRGLFRTDLAGQGMRFMTTLTTIAELVDEPGELTQEIEALALSHRGIGVRAEHFGPMGDALLVTLGETLGPAFTCELQAAWRSAYDRFAAAMIARGGFG